MGWEYKREESSSFNTKIPEGKHRIRIKAAEKAVSKTGNNMLTLQFEVSGYDGIIYHHIVFLADKPEITNRNLTQFFDSFKGIPEGQFDVSKWIGQVGAAQVKHEEYNGNTNAKIHYFIAKDKQAELPNWKEPDGTEVDENGFMSIPDGVGEEMPW